MTSARVISLLLMPSLLPDIHICEFFFFPVARNFPGAERKLRFLYGILGKKSPVLKALHKTLRNSSNLPEKSFGSIDYALGNSQKCWDSKSIVKAERYILSSLSSALVPKFVLI